jgi:fructokinase
MGVTASHLTPRPVVFGEVLFDCFESGERMLGGAPYNVASHLQGFGLSPVLISCVGVDTAGDEVATTMRRRGMTTIGLQRDPLHGTGEVHVRVERGQPAYEIVADRAYDHIRADFVPPLAAALIYHGTLALRRETSAHALQQLVSAPDARVFIDVNLRAPWWRPEHVDALLRHARWVKVNEEELCAITGERGDPRAIAGRLLETYELERIIVTLGAAGAFSVAGGGAVAESGPVEPGPIVDTVGAGDAFAAVSIAGLLRGWAADETVRRAQSFAQLIVAQRGALLHDDAIYRSLRETWQLP